VNLLPGRDIRKEEIMDRLLILLLGAFALVLLCMNSNLHADPIEGTWKTFDDKTGEPKSLVNISVDDGRLYGEVIQIFPEEGEDPDPVCEKCPGELRNQKIVGMMIINGLEEKDGTWSGGKILDPENGKSYRCKLWLEDDNLRVRGSLLVFHRTQTWIREVPDPRDEAVPAGRSADLYEAAPEAVEEDSSARNPE
jgi:uncharacterized protein (DUF2147 family)